MISELERAGQLNRALEALPSDEELAARTDGRADRAGVRGAARVREDRRWSGRSSPTASPTRSGPPRCWSSYFPTPLRERFADRMAEHRLRRDIVTTVLVNEVVNRGGISFVYRVVEETGASAADVIRAYVVVREVFGLRELWAAVEALDNQVRPSVQTARLPGHPAAARPGGALAGDQPAVADRRAGRDRPAARRGGPAAARAGDCSTAASGTRCAAHIDALTDRGLPRDLAEQATRLMYSFGLLDVVETAAATGRDVGEVASVYFVLSDRFRVDSLLSKISAAAARGPLADAGPDGAALRPVRRAGRAHRGGARLHARRDLPPQERVRQWEQSNATSIHRTRRAMGEFDESRADLAALSVLLRQIRTLVRTSAASRGRVLAHGADGLRPAAPLLRTVGSAPGRETSRQRPMLRSR